MSLGFYVWSKYKSKSIIFLLIYPEETSNRGREDVYINAITLSRFAIRGGQRVMGDFVQLSS